MSRACYVYILSSHRRRLYVGVTNDLARRLAEHRDAARHTHTGRYLIDRLVYFEAWSRPMDAIQREKQIKGWIRQRKIELIESVNPNWRDLSAELR
jgi:putative endonuclease